MIIIKTKKEIELMKAAGEVVALLLRTLGEAVAPGMKTLELDIIAADIIKKMGAIPSFKGYEAYGNVPPFPASICTSVNDEVVHGIPGNVVLNEGDIISVDVGACKYGFHADAARTFAVGKISDKAEKLISVARESFFNGIKMAVEGNRVGDISAEVQRTVERNGFSVVRDLVGHGIGRDLHEEPQIPNFAVLRKGVRLAKGMALAVEPMINEGGFRVKTKENQWTVATLDGSLSAHYENTIIVTSKEPLILTL
jgi:methionyl aminopeptidase